MDQNINNYVNTLFGNMEVFSQQDGLIGKPVTQGDKTFLPVMSITLGYGGGDTHANAKTNTGANTTTNTGGGSSGGALGLGAKLSADAVIVIDKGNVLMAPIGAAPGGISQIINQIPQILSGMGQGSQGSQQGAQGTQQGSQSGSQPKGIQ